MAPSADGSEPGLSRSGGRGGDELVVEAREVQVGDHVLIRGEYYAVLKVRNAQGRKPRTGYNLHLLTTGRMVRAHSAQGVSIRRGADGTGPV